MPAWEVVKLPVPKAQQRIPTSTFKIEMLFKNINIMKNVYCEE